MPGRKNMGPAGVNLVVVDKRILGKVKRAIPTIMDYRNHINEDSMLNTRRFCHLFGLLTLRWLKAEGRRGGHRKINREKATAQLYAAIDENPLFTGTTVKEDRSMMNACFVMNDLALEEPFCVSPKNGVVGIKGTSPGRRVRASLYNALPWAACRYSPEAMKEFALQH